MKLGDTVRITKPDGAEHLFDIKIKSDIEYYSRFPVGDFTLHVLPKVRVHNFADSSCIACE